MPVTEEISLPSSTRARAPLGVLITVLGGGFLQASQFLVVVLIAKFASSSALGLYVAALAAVTPIVSLCAIELRAVYVADAVGQFAEQAYRIVRRVSLIAMGAGILAVAVRARFGSAESTLAIMIGGVGAMRWALASADLNWGVFQRRDQLVRYGVAGALRGISLLLAFGAAVLLVGALRESFAPDTRTDVVAVVLGALLTSAIWLLLTAWETRVIRASSVQPAAPGDTRVFPILLRGLPLGVVSLLIATADAYPRLVMARYPDSSRELGYIGALAYIPLAASILTVLTAGAVSGRLSAGFQHDRGAFLSLLGRLILFAGVLAAALICIAYFFGSELLRVIYAAEYAVHSREFVVICGAGALTLFTNVLGVAATQMQRFWLQVPIHVGVLAATIAATEWFVRPGQLLAGAANAGVVRALVQFVAYAAVVIWTLRRAGRATPDLSGYTSAP